MEIKEGIRDRLRGAAKAVKKGVEQEKNFSEQVVKLLIA